MKTTRILIVALFITLGIYDVIALEVGGLDATISHFFTSLSPYPLPVFTCGMLFGHFFVRMPSTITPMGEQTIKDLRAEVARLQGLLNQCHVITRPTK